MQNAFRVSIAILLAAIGLVGSAMFIWVARASATTCSSGCGPDAEACHGTDTNVCGSCNPDGCGSWPGKKHYTNTANHGTDTGTSRYNPDGYVTCTVTQPCVNVTPIDATCWAGDCNAFATGPRPCQPCELGSETNNNIFDCQVLSCPSEGG